MHLCAILMSALLLQFPHVNRSTPYHPLKAYFHVI